MPNFIKNSADEKAWNQALDLARSRWKERETNPKLEPIKNIWAYANWLRLNLFSENKSLVVESEGLINSDEDDQIWKAIRYYAFSNKKQMDESEIYDYIENAFLAYKEKHEGKPSSCRRKLLEFVNSYGSSMAGSYMGTQTTGMMGFGGQRDERPIGPIVYGYDYPGVKRNVTSSPDSDKKAIVVIPPKQDAFKATGELDNQGNLKSDVENSQKITIEQANMDEQLDGPFGDILVRIMDLTGISMSELQELDDEELEDLLIKAAKIDNKNSQQLNESIQEQEMLIERDSPIQKARKILAIKHKQKKSIEKVDGRKYVWNQNDIIKLMSKYGYKYDKKYKKWAKKRSPTYDARRILSDKYQDKLAVEKNDEGEYKLDQDDVRKRMHSHNYFYDLDKKRWTQQYDIPEQPKPIEVEPTPKYVPPKPSIIQPKSIKPSPEKEEPVSIKKTPEPKEEPKKVKIEKPANPIYSLENKEKIKEMEARFILGASGSMADATSFNKDEETGEYIPVVSKEDVLNKMNLLQYNWNDLKNIWLNDANTLPQKLYELNETPKTIIARAFLASIGKVNKIKVKEDGSPSVSYEDLDDAMESQDMYYDSKAERWKVIEEDELDEETDVICTDINETDYDEEILCEEYSYEDDEGYDELEEAKNFVDPEHTYNLSDVSDAQGRFLLRALQLDMFKDYIGKPDENSIWMKIQTGGDGDPTAFDKNTPKMSENTILKNLKSLGYTFNNDKDLPMWIKGGNDVPSDLKNILNIDEKEYIARGILGSNDKTFIQFDTSDKNVVEPYRPSGRVINTITSGKRPYIWNDEYGWISNKQSQVQNIPSKTEKSQFDSIRPIANKPFSSLTKAEQDQYKEYKARTIAQEYGKKPWDEMNSYEKNKAMKKVKLNYEFDRVNKRWKELSSPKPGFIRRAAKTLYNGAKRIGKWLGPSSPLAGMFKSWSIN
jgi:hypothetical protein